jgi:hypothetical protein
MSNRFPLIIDAATQRILELPATDNLDLSSSNISNVSNINSVGNVTASYFIGNGSSLTGVTASPAGSNTQIQFNDANTFGASANFTINTSTGVLAAPNFSGNGASLSSITGANVTGTVPNAANVTGNAQSNITSVGNLTSVVVSGNANITNTNLVKFGETVIAGGNTGAATLTPNAAAGTIYTYTLTGNITLSALSNAVAGTSMTIILTQDGTGNRLLTSTMKFAGNSKTLSTAANTIDIMGVFYDGSTYYASLTKGYV